MCLAIPARLIEYVDADRQFGKVELGGVTRRVNTSLLIGEDTTEVGEYVLVHVGFALSRVSEEEAAETLRLLEEMGPAYTDELDQIRQWEGAHAETPDETAPAAVGAGLGDGVTEGASR